MTRVRDDRPADGDPGPSGAAGSPSTPYDLGPDELRDIILDSCVDAVIAHTPEGDLLYANAEALRQWRCDSADEIKARGPWGWVPKEQQAHIASRMTQLAADGQARFESVGRFDGESGPHGEEIHARLADTPYGRIIISVVRDVSNRMESDELVRYLAYHDCLTGLANRALFEQDLMHALAAADRHNDEVGLVFIDLDEFKPVNDTLGHANGDRVLRKVASRITECVRLTDTVARIGGDEFVMLLPRISGHGDLIAVARKTAEEISRPMHIGEITVRLSASLGLAMYQRGETCESFVTRADLAMYESRKPGSPGWGELAV